MATAEIPEPLPHNVEAEAALLGALMIENRLVDHIADRLQSHHFFEPVHARIYEAVVRECNFGRVATPVTLKPYFADDAALKDLGGPAYLAQLTGSGAAVIGARDFADQVIELARLRALVGIGQEIVERAKDTAADRPFAELVAFAESKIAEISGEADDGTLEVSLAQAMSDMLDGEADTDGVTCGIEAIDKALGAIRPKEMVVIAGRPGMGKTIVGLCYSLGVVRAHDDLDFQEVHDAVLFVSLEMSAKQLAQRAAADLCFDGHRGIYYGDIVDRKLTNEQSRQVARATLRLQDRPLQIIDAPRMTVGRLGSTVRRWKRRFAARGQRLRLVVVDYLQLVQPDQREKDLYTRITEVSKGIKAIAKANDVPIIALAQLSRDVEKRGGDHRPNLGDLRDSGQIEQDADGVMFLYRAEYYLKKDERADEAHPKHEAWEAAMNLVRGQIEYIVAKRRERPEATTRGRFHGSFQAVR
jgi:replicative DNA helicase